MIRLFVRIMKKKIKCKYYFPLNYCTIVICCNIKCYLEEVNIVALAKWWKIDFHTHTPDSNCFRNKEISAKDWVNAALDVGLDAVVVTDHNSVGWIEKIREAAKQIKEENPKRDLFVFPGIEICVGVTFTHIIIIFDPVMNYDDIESFLIKCGFDKSKWGCTTENVSEDVLEKLIGDYGDRLLLVPAHFSKNKGLGQLNQNAISAISRKIRFDAIEVRDEEDFREYENKVGNNIIPKCALITGSDNPCKENEGHDIGGLGKKFTWVKMSKLSIEGLRQAFIDYESRCCSVIHSSVDMKLDKNEIFHSYLSGMRLNNLKHIDNLNFRLSPNLNCIIGGRGTGKSTIIEIIRLALKNETKNSIVDNTWKDDTVIDIFYNYGTEYPYQINLSGTKNKKKRIISNESGTINEYPSFMADIYGQKEIFSLVESDNDSQSIDESPLLRIIDSNIKVDKVKIETKLNGIQESLSALSQQLNSVRSQIMDTPRIRAEIEINNSKLTKFKESGIVEKRSKYSQLKNEFERLSNSIEEYKMSIETSTKDINSKAECLKGVLLNEDCVSFKSDFYKDVNQNVEQVHTQINEAFTFAFRSIDIILEQVNNSGLAHDLNNAKLSYEEIMEDLNGQDIENFKQIEERNIELAEQLKHLSSLEGKEMILLTSIEEEVEKYIKIYREITELRNTIINQINTTATNIKLKLLPFSHGRKWLYSLRKELGKVESFNEAFEQLYNKIYVNDIVNELELKKWLLYILTTKDGSIGQFLGVDSIDSRFETIWKDRFKKGTLNSLYKIVPEDRVDIKIINDNSDEININEGSPGQKCAALLAFILNQGENPLIIDQPEDDLDNSLILTLIVDNIRKIKNKRQVIVVTHNPNIPVLGDAEGILVLDRNAEGKIDFRDGKKTGCIEEKGIKNGICEIMEGGIVAFEKREKKYKYVKPN